MVNTAFRKKVLLQYGDAFDNRLVTYHEAHKIKTAGEFIVEVKGEFLFAWVNPLREQGDHLIAQNIHYFDGHAAVLGHVITQVDLIGNGVWVNLYIADQFIGIKFCK